MTAVERDLEPDLGTLSPLAEIELLVQRRARDLSIDTNAISGRNHVRTLVHEEIARWNAEHRRGRRPFALADPDLMCDRALRNLLGYGPLQPLLDDDDVWEVMINAPDAIFVKRHHGPSGFHDEVFHDDEHVTRTLTKILDDASTSHRKLDPAEGLQDAQLADGARLHIVHADCARGGHVMVNIRKYTGVIHELVHPPVHRPLRGGRSYGPSLPQVTSTVAS
jgi:pilus assembly protein CpaF